MRLKRLVEIKRSQTRHIKARQPHCAHEGNAERILRLLEVLLQLLARDIPLVGLDVDTELLEILDIPLLLTDDELHPRLFHPRDALLQLLLTLVRPSGLLYGILRRLVQLLGVLLPLRGNGLPRAIRRDLVDAHEHGLAAPPPRRVVPHEVLRLDRDGLRRHVDHDLGLDGVIHPLAVLRIEVLLLHRLDELLVDGRRIDAKLVDPRLVEERHGRMVLDRAVEVVDGHILTKLLLRQVAALKRRSREPNTRGIRQEPKHVVREDAIVGAVRLVGEDDDLMVEMNRRPCRGIELVDQREQETVVPLQPFPQPLAGRWHARFRKRVAKAPAARERPRNLLVQLVAVRHDQEGRRTARLAQDLSREEHHRIALARSLRVPEDPYLAVLLLPLQITPIGVVHPEILVVAGEHLEHVPVVRIEEDEVLHQIEEVRPRAHPFDKLLQRHDRLVILGMALPLPEELPVAPERPDVRLVAVREDQHRVEAEQPGNRGKIVLVVLVVSFLVFMRRLLELHEEKRQTVHESDQVGTLHESRRGHPQLAYAQELVVRSRRIVEVDQLRPPLRLAVLAEFLIRHLHAVPNEFIRLGVELHQRLAVLDGFQFFNRLLNLRIRDPIPINPLERRPYRPPQHRFRLVRPSEHPVRSKRLGIIRQHARPPDGLHHFRRGFLHDVLLGIGPAHVLTPRFPRSSASATADPWLRSKNE